MDKKALRAEFLKIRREIPREKRIEKSRIIAERLFETAEYEGAKLVFAYASYGAEAETWGIIERAFSNEKRVALSVMLEEKGKMAFIEIRSSEGLVKNKTGILEPIYNEEAVVYPQKGDIIIVPGAAFTAEGARLGYGGGYYDRYLSKYGGCFKVGICFKEQLAKDLPQEKFDIKIDKVITG